MALIKQEDITELQNKLENLNSQKADKETQKEEWKANGEGVLEDKTNITAKLNKIKNDIELNSKLKEDLTKFIKEKEDLLIVTGNSEKANIESREDLKAKLEVSSDERDAKISERKGREEKKADLELSKTSTAEELVKMQTEYNEMADGPDKDSLLEKIQSLQNKQVDLTNKIATETTAISELQADIGALSTSIEADNATMKGLEIEHKEITETLDKTKTEVTEGKSSLNQAMAEGDNMVASRSETEANLESINKEYTKIKTDIKNIEGDISNIGQEIKNIEEGDLIKQFEEETEDRKNLVKSTFLNTSRVAPLINNSNEGLDSVVSDYSADTNLFIKDIKEEIGFNSAAEDLLQNIVQELKENDKVLSADQALELTRKSLFNIQQKGIEDKIKVACEKGLTSIKLTSSQISATQIVALNSLGYKVTHYSIPQPHDIPDLMGVIIEWGLLTDSAA